MLAQQQPPQQQQPDYLGGNDGNDERSNHEIERDIHQLQREMHAVLLEAVKHYRALHTRAMYDIQVLELRDARARETFDWPTPPPARPPIPMSPAQRSYNLHAHIGQSGSPGRMRIVEAAAAAEREDWERKHG